MSAAEGRFDYTWPDADFGRIPDWIYTSDEIYEREQERIFQGATWNFVGFEAEVPEAGDFRRSYVGTIPVIVSRAKDGEVYVFENRCRHRGVELCRDLRGSNPEFICPYHQWAYDLNGDLIGVPFRRGHEGPDRDAQGFRSERKRPRAPQNRDTRRCDIRVVLR